MGDSPCLDTEGAIIKTKEMSRRCLEKNVQLEAVKLPNPTKNLGVYSLLVIPISLRVGCGAILVASM